MAVPYKYMKTMIQECMLLIVFVTFISCQSDSGRNLGEGVAQVNSEVIPIKTFEKALQRLSKYPGRDYSSLDARKELVKEMIDQELLFQDAMKKKFVYSSEELRKEIAREYIKSFVNQYKYDVSNKEIENVFKQKKNDFEQVRVSHILIKPKNVEKKEYWLVAEKKAMNILNEIQQKKQKADFSQFAKKYSEDLGTKNNGGDLGFFTRDKMVPEFSEAAFGLERIGDLSNLVKTQHGYHILKLTGEQRGVQYFAPTIKMYIEKQKQKEKADQLLSELRGKARIKMQDQAMINATSQSLSTHSIETEKE